MNFARVQLLGRVAADPETDRMPSGEEVAHFTVMTNSGSQSKDAAPTAMRCVAFGRYAGVVAQRFRRGSLVTVAGDLVTRKWRPEGSEKDVYITEVKVTDIPIWLSNPAQVDTTPPDASMDPMP